MNEYFHFVIVSPIFLFRGENFNWKESSNELEKVNIKLADQGQKMTTKYLIVSNVY